MPPGEIFGDPRDGGVSVGSAAAAAVVVRPSRRRVLNALQALSLQALHVAYMYMYGAGPSATYDVPAWASGRPSQVVVSSAAGLIITVTDGADRGEGEFIEREAGCATGVRARPCRA